MGSGSNRYRASEAGGCRRQIWYRVSGYQPWPENPINGMAYVVGNALHDVTRAMMDAHGIKLDGLEFMDDYSIEETDKLQVQVDGITLSSRTDGSLGSAYPGMQNTLLEIKTISEWPFKAMEKVYKSEGNAAAVEYMKERYAYYYAQTQITAGMLGVPWVYLLVVLRDNLKIGLEGQDHKRHCLVFPFDQKEFDKQVKRFKQVDKARLAGKAPEPDYEEGSKGCTYCKFSYLCPSGSNYGAVHPSNVEA